MTGAVSKSLVLVGNHRANQAKMLIWVQSIQAGQQPYQVEVSSECGTVHELKLAVLKEENIDLSGGHIYLRMGRYGPKAFIRDKLSELFPHGQARAHPFWYVLLCPGNYGNPLVCPKGMFEPKRTKFPAPILKYDKQLIARQSSIENHENSCSDDICSRPRVTFYLV